ncbi:unnamed protein product, partial [Amoebophrya sp. A120]
EDNAAIDQTFQTARNNFSQFGTSTLMSNSKANSLLRMLQSSKTAPGLPFEDDDLTTTKQLSFSLDKEPLKLPMTEIAMNKLFRMLEEQNFERLIEEEIFKPTS